jgi:hypothetical protein
VAGAVLWADHESTLALAAGGCGEAGDAGGGERVEELFERPGLMEVAGLLLESGADCFRCEVVEVEQEVVGVDRFDADRFAGFGWGVVEVESDDELGVGGDCGTARTRRQNRCG